MGDRVADVTARVIELLHSQPDGFIVNAQSLGTDPKPGKGKLLTIDYDYKGHAFTLIISAGKKVSYQTLLENQQASSGTLTNSPPE